MTRGLPMLFKHIQLIESKQCVPKKIYKMMINIVPLVIIVSQCIFRIDAKHSIPFVQVHPGLILFHFEKTKRIYTNTQTPKHTNTQTPKHTNTHAHTHTTANPNRHKKKNTVLLNVIYFDIFYLIPFRSSRKVLD